MSEERLTRLRSLRRRCNVLLASAADDIASFVADDKLTFRWLQQKAKDHVSIASTCTCLMTGVTTDTLDRIYAKVNAAPDAPPTGRSSAKAALDSVFAAPWTSSGLENGNAFTTTIVARTTGMLVTAHVVTAEDARTSTHSIEFTEELEQIVLRISAAAPAGLGIVEFPPHPALGYWLVEAIVSLKIVIADEVWKKLASWAATTFFRELSQVVSQNDALMDPVALVMSACLCRRIQSLASGDDFKDGDKVLADLPSLVELQYGVKQFLAKQHPSGLWPNYFPLFRYRGAANHCFTFECLEAVIESFFGTPLLEDDGVLDSFARALTWCESNKLTYATDRKRYFGWSSGGDRIALGLGQPEVWATGTVYMFAHRLQHLIGYTIQRVIEDKYQAVMLKSTARWTKLIDLPIVLGGAPTTLKNVLEEQIIAPTDGESNPKRRSGLLFGPPGTSKTSLVRALAERIGWPMIEVNPSRFLRSGLENVYVSAEEVFEDLSDLRRVVILFDEVDALVKSRDDENPLDPLQQFLTTTMLPHLTKLHQREHVVFFMATNHQRDFDLAIKRPGRFDMLLCVGPPSWADKLARIDAFAPNEDPEQLRDAFEGKVNDKVARMLDYFTFDEFASLLSDLRRVTNRHTCIQAVETVSEVDFNRIVSEWYKDRITLREGGKNSARSEFEDDREQSRLQ
jgi:hypothetical protein